MDADVLIAGGGAAGLAAADVLARAGRSSIVIEARERLGGRIASVHDPRSPVPLELGPEFVHGTPEVTLARLRRAGTTVVDNAGEAWAPGADGRLVCLDASPFDAAAALLGRGARAERRPADDDESVEAFLARSTADEAGSARWVRSLVAGFDAADPARASVRDIAAEWRGDASARGTQSRPLGGYAPLVRSLASALDPARVALSTGRVLRAFSQDGAGVRARLSEAGGRECELRAPYAICTLPLGVLQRALPDGVAFDPPLSESKRAALARLVSGPVRKVVLLFGEPVWERTHGGRYGDAAFFHQEPEAAFPTFWTQLPLRAPSIVAWAGGPAADALADLDDESVAARALDEFGRMLGDPVAVRRAFRQAFTHDWQRDPFALGAYSYVATGGATARARLADLEGRIAFAGEATATSGEGGTVAGALASGERAARQLLALWSEARA